MSKTKFKSLNHKINPRKFFLKICYNRLKKVYNIFLKEANRIIFPPQGTVYVLAESCI